MNPWDGVGVKWKRPNLKVQPLISFVRQINLSELVDVDCQLRLQVVSLVLVDNVCLSQFIQQFCNAWIHGCCGSLICSRTKFTNSISHGLTIISVVKSSFLFLSDSFQ